MKMLWASPQELALLELVWQHGELANEQKCVACVRLGEATRCHSELDTSPGKSQGERTASEKALSSQHVTGG